MKTIGVVLVLRYSDDEEGSPWSVFLYVDDRADPEQRLALEEIFLGLRGGDIEEHAPWIWKEKNLLGVAAAAIEIDHTPRRQWFRVRDHVEVRVSAPVPDQGHVSCVIPGARRPGQIEENASASDLAPLSASQMAAVKELYDSKIRRQVHQRW